MLKYFFPRITYMKMKLKMKLSMLHIFIIILVALALCSCVGAMTYEGFHESTSGAKPSNGKNVMGIPKSMIPKGDEDLYILKSQVVPPVCPACPSIATCPDVNSEKKCPPCPPCGRCPEPAFECKKVPNYAAAKKNKVAPRAVLSDFSSFGM